jgi:hypothetical protein
MDQFKCTDKLSSTKYHSDRLWGAEDQLWGAEDYGDAVDLLLDRVLPCCPARRCVCPKEFRSAVKGLPFEGTSYVTGDIFSVDDSNSYPLLPLVETDDAEHLPFYLTLPRKQGFGNNCRLLRWLMESFLICKGLFDKKCPIIRDCNILHSRIRQPLIPDQRYYG